MKLEPLAVWFQPAAGPLLPQLRPFLLAAGQAQAGASARLLRWAITAAEPARGLRIEAVLVVAEPGSPGQQPTAAEGSRPSQASEALLSISAPLPTLLVIPTGIGCAVGGYAGDGLPAARLLAAASGCLVTHPNVLNGAALYWSDRRIHYVEGWALDRFACGELALAPVPGQRVGLLLDGGIEPELRARQLQAAEACRATLGLAIGPVLSTDVPLGVGLSLGPSGSSWGTLERPDALLRAGEKLVAAGATAVAVVARFPDDPGSDALAAYRHGAGVDALAGAEAVISHLLVQHLGIPCAHAPALAPLPLDQQLDPRAAAEELGHTFLPCVLVGLSRAPDLVAPRDRRAVLLAEDLGAVVAPAGALGGEAVLASVERGVPLIAVSGNPCLLQVDGAALGLPVLPASTYSEAAGLVLALREGLNPGALVRPLGMLA